MKYKIPFIKPDFPAPDDISSDYEVMVESNWFTNFGPFEERFSAKIAEYVGCGARATTVNNATSGLILSILALLGKGDGASYIIMPSFTFVAGAQAVEWCGYRPFFVDINSDDFNMSIDHSEQLLMTRKNISAILFCNSFGVGSTQIDEWERLAAEYSVPLIIDSAAGFGSKYTDVEFVGARGSCEVFSFHATKPLAVGEGGAVTSRSPELIQNIRQLQNFGFDVDRMTKLLGLNAKMQELNAAIGLRQLSVHKERVLSRQATLRRYEQGLQDVIFQKNDNISSVCFASVLIHEGNDRNAVIEKLQNKGVEARAYYTPLHKQPYYSKNTSINSVSLENTDAVSRRIVSLPVHDNMDDQSIQCVIDNFNSSTKK